MAGQRLIPHPENASIEELKKMSRIGSPETSLRCTAIQFLITGVKREQVCAALMVSERSVRNWIKAFNEKGIDGLVVKKRPGRTRIFGKKDSENMTFLIENPEKANRTFWTATAFYGYLCDTYAIECSYSTVVRFFHRNEFVLKVPRPWSEQQDEAQREAFLEELKQYAEKPDVDIWFADESGFDGDPRPRRRWDKKGKKTRVNKTGNHIRMNVMGMVCPRTGQFFAIEVSHSDSETFQAFLDESGKFIHFERPRNILIIDNASWHRKKSLNWNHFEPKYLPAYSPDLNPIERIWLVMKARWFNNYLCKNVETLIDRLDHALLDIISKPNEVKKTASIGKLI